MNNHNRCISYLLCAIIMLMYALCLFHSFPLCLLKIDMSLDLKIFKDGGKIGNLKWLKYIFSLHEKIMQNVYKSNCVEKKSIRFFFLKQWLNSFVLHYSNVDVMSLQCHQTAFGVKRKHQWKNYSYEWRQKYISSFCLFLM